MSLAAWASYLPEVHPFLLDMAQTIDRTVSRFEGRIGVLQAELAQITIAARQIDKRFGRMRGHVRRPLQRHHRSRRAAQLPVDARNACQRIDAARATGRGPPCI